MAEYIERKAAMIVCDKHYRECLRMQNWAGDSVAYNIADDIRELPAADVVEVVRCENCVLHERCRTENTFKFARIDNPFCCAGARRSE